MGLSGLLIKGFAGLVGGGDSIGRKLEWQGFHPEQGARSVCYSTKLSRCVTPCVRGIFPHSLAIVPPSRCTIQQNKLTALGLTLHCPPPMAKGTMIRMGRNKWHSTVYRPALPSPPCGRVLRLSHLFAFAYDTIAVPR